MCWEDAVSTLLAQNLGPLLTHMCDDWALWPALPLHYGSKKRLRFTLPIIISIKAAIEHIHITIEVRQEGRYHTLGISIVSFSNKVINLSE